MRLLRSSSALLRLVLAWWVLALGVAAASAVVAPKTLEVLCSSGGALTLVVVDQHGDLVENGAHTLDCALCLPASPPPPVAMWQPDLPQPLAQAMKALVEARIAALVGAPLPPRGPPALA